MRTNWISCRLLFLLSIYVVIGCSRGNPTDSANIDDGGGEGKVGFGVSGLLFENNLVMWFRENDGTRSELFPQMYFTRADAGNFPVWGDFPDRYLVSGGVPRDGIPALVSPPFAAPGAPELSYLRGTDLVLGVVIDGEAKAYPHNILWWHEIVNDKVGGQEIIVSFCPLTGTGLIFEMPENGNEIDKLTLLPTIETTWQKWQELYPSSTAISQNTGFSRNYTLYPYSSYRQENSQPLFALRTGSIDSRFPQKHTVLGLIFDDSQMAYAFSRLNNNPVLNDDRANRRLVVVSDISARLAIPYNRVVDGQALTFQLKTTVPFEMEDEQTGSSWNLKGEAISGPLAGKRLQQVPAYNAFWFAWAAFWPDTQIF